MMIASESDYLPPSPSSDINLLPLRMENGQYKPVHAGDNESESDRLSEGRLVRQLKTRHVAMISLGGAIGTGLFLKTATSLTSGGPIGLLLGYATIGTICYTVMISLGEMISYLPIAGGHITLAERFVDPSFSFAMGWNYWYYLAILLPTELSAASVLISYWQTTINGAVWITICMIVVVAINLTGASIYGEAEFIFASIKVITIVGVIILGIVLDLGGGPNHDRIGFRYWINPGPFVQFEGIAGAKGRFLGYFAVVMQAAFSFIGTEIVAIAAGEAKNPRHSLPKAVKRVYIRILLFYIGGTIIIGLLVPSNDPRLDITTANSLASSPFVIAINQAGIKALPTVINACLITSAWSAASSDLFTSSRAIYGLAASGNAPRIFLKTLPNGLPIVAVLFNSSFALLSYMGIQQGSSSGQIFIYLSQMTSIAGLLTWFGISVTYLRFYKGMKAQGIDRTKLPYYSEYQPFAAWYAVCAISVIMLLSGWAVFLKDKWNAPNFVTNYIALMLFPILYLGARMYYKERPKRPLEMDFLTNIDEIEADSYDEPRPRNVFEAFWQWLF